MTGYPYTLSYSISVDGLQNQMNFDRILHMIIALAGIPAALFMYLQKVV